MQNVYFLQVTAIEKKNKIFVILLLMITFAPAIRQIALICEQHND